jgi:sugar O-acyltransferase (sialic acid O-acetyltransferase NeuD family)
MDAAKAAAQTGGPDVTTSLIVIGGGEHARVVLEAALSSPERWTVRGFVDPEACDKTVRLLGVRRIGGDDAIASLATQDSELQFIIGVGDTGATHRRREIVARLREYGIQWATVIHADASVSPTARVGHGVVVMAGSVVNAGAHLGDHTVVNTGAIVEHDVELGEFTQLGPRACIGGGSSLGAECYVGLGACIRDHISVGAGAIVGMGAVVVGDVDASTLVMGVPARGVVRERR